MESQKILDELNDILNDANTGNGLATAEYQDGDRLLFSFSHTGKFGNKMSEEIVINNIHRKAILDVAQEICDTAESIAEDYILPDDDEMPRGSRTAREEYFDRKDMEEAFSEFPESLQECIDAIIAEDDEREAEEREYDEREESNWLASQGRPIFAGL